MQHKINDTDSSKNLIYLFSYKPTAWDAERYGFQYLLDNGVNLKVFDMSSMISSRKQSPNDFNYPYIKKINSYKDFAEEVKNNSRTAIYIDEINGLNGFQWQGRKIFQILKKYNAPYFLVEIGSLPLIAPQDSRYWYSRLLKALNLKKLIAFLKWKAGKQLVNMQEKYLHSYQLPSKIFVGNSDMVMPYLHRYGLSKDILIPIHSFDYDRYLKHLREHKTTEVKDKKTCVFLDQALINHSDFGQSISFSPVTAEKYLPSMNQFFNKVERETGLELVIAASPRASIHAMQNMYGNRKVIKNKTLELVADSSLVLMHSSTAVSFPILFNKPILILKTAEMMHAHGYGNFLNNMAKSLGLKPILIDSQIEIHKLNLHDYDKWKNNYDEYKFKYIMTPGLMDKTIWEILIEHIDHKLS